ncbi:hypothetical protein MOUN0_K07162 [Monosporozyma unispora]|nr:hypothetical protein C6P44_004588 [Kazachstania unispora]
MPKRSPLAKEYQKELSKYDEYMRQVVGLEKISTTLLRKISSTIRILEDMEHDELIQSILTESTNDPMDYIPPMLSENAMRFVPGIEKYNDMILKICEVSKNDIDNNTIQNTLMPPEVQDSYIFTTETPMLHKDLEE